jgi:hypothetical protein
MYVLPAQLGWLATHAGAAAASWAGSGRARAPAAKMVKRTEAENFIVVMVCGTLVVLRFVSMNELMSNVDRAGSESGELK